MTSPTPTLCCAAEASRSSPSTRSGACDSRSAFAGRTATGWSPTSTTRSPTRRRRPRAAVRPITEGGRGNAAAAATPRIARINGHWAPRRAFVAIRPSLCRSIGHSACPGGKLANRPACRTARCAGTHTAPSVDSLALGATQSTLAGGSATTRRLAGRHDGAPAVDRPMDGPTARRAAPPGSPYLKTGYAPRRRRTRPTADVCRPTARSRSRPGPLSPSGIASGRSRSETNAPRPVAASGSRVLRGTAGGRARGPPGRRTAGTRRRARRR